MGRMALGIALLAVAAVAVGWVAIQVVSTLLGLAWYLIIGAVAIGGGVYLYRRARRAVAPGTRNGNRIEALRKTYEIRDR